MAIATCGHEVEEGIQVSYKGTTRDGEPCVIYATYCAKCAYELFKRGEMLGEMSMMLSLVGMESFLAAPKCILSGPIEGIKKDIDNLA